MRKNKIFGIAFHSPLDIDALLPVGIRTSLDANSESDCLFSPSVQESEKIQFVFSPVKYLQKLKINILDWDSKKRKRIVLKGSHLDKILTNEEENGSN